MGKRIITALAALVILSAPGLFAQDPGIRDTVYVDSVKVTQGGKAVVNINFYNDEELAAVQIPLKYSSPDISVDSISFVGSRLAYLSNKIININNSIRQFIVVGIVISEANVPPGQGLAAKVHFNIPAGITDQKAYIDSALFPPGSDLNFIDANTNNLIAPVFKRGIIVIGNPLDPPVIGVDQDSLYFEGIAGSTPPATKILRITNLGQGTMNWTATKKSTWLEILPPSGIAPSNVQIYANSVGLPVGTYYDTIVVSSPSATNSPVSVPVRLRLTEPPPTISLAPTAFFFSAVADSSNPPDQILTVKNVGQGVLEWTASKSSSWLGLNPTSGTDSDQVTLSVDITGLAYGFYYDTVVISDADATNDPQIATVRLEVASGLPLLAVDSPFIFVVVPIGTFKPPDRSFLVYNGGGGSMTFSVSETSSRIVSLTPSSGTAPLAVTAGFDTKVGSAGDDYFDTVVVTSPEAINSPQYVVFQFHYVQNPAQLALNKDSIVANYYECGDGTGPPPPAQTFSIFNYGTDPAYYELSWTSSWLHPNRDNGPIPAMITLNFTHKGFPVGDYYDTIVVSAVNAINSPVRLPVVMHILPTAVIPTIALSFTDTVHFTAQENRPGKEFFIDVNNANPGCMSWAVDEDIDWLTYVIDSSNNQTYPWEVEFRPFAGGMVWGKYYDACQITSPSATNSPVTINFKFEVWKFFGDCNYDGKINALDVTYLIRFIYKGGPLPKPESRVGDCNCDYYINIMDITELINYLYIDLNPICGNPY